MSLYSSQGNLIYSDASSASASSLSLVAAQSYKLNLMQANALPNTAYSLVMTQTDIPAYDENDGSVEYRCEHDHSSNAW